ncbi:Aldolase-type TIM barrel [Penicillium expansum]|nr:Aldolase-type TIM barrel [Penicillium expansum]KGO68593.1 Aldolase-type TIM barrel [Penicillium expansum]
MANNSIPHSSLCVTTTDFEKVAKDVLPEKSWVYASSSAATGLSMRTNLDDWSLINFRPRILRSVDSMDTRRNILGHTSQFPFFVSAMGTLGSSHPGAEPLLVRGATRKGMQTMISTASTKPLEEIMDAHLDEQRLLGNQSPSNLSFQLYVPVDRTRAKSLIQRVKAAGYQSLWVTVDTSTLGKRTADRYLQAQENLDAGLDENARDIHGENDFAPAFGGRQVPGSVDGGLTWEDLNWISSEWDGPLVLKGIQSVEDVKLAVQHGVQGILLSNHGGRQIHSAPSSLMTLLEIRTYYPEAFDKLQVFVDGGLRDGADVLKALCLGATAVGVGRPYYYALAAYGAEGVERCTDILAEELEITMKMLGVSSLDQLGPDMVNTSRLANEMWRPVFGKSKL